MVFGQLCAGSDSGRNRPKDTISTTQIPVSVPLEITVPDPLLFRLYSWLGLQIESLIHFDRHYSCHRKLLIEFHTLLDQLSADEAVTCPDFSAILTYGTSRKREMHQT